MKHQRYRSVASLAALLLVGAAGCGELFVDTDALELTNGDKVNADEIRPNARPRVEAEAVAIMYDGSEITPIDYTTYSDAEAFYLLVQVQRGWDLDLNLQEKQPFELRKFVGLGKAPEQVPLPRNIEPMGEDVLAGGCRFVDTTEVGMLAFFCGGEFAVRPADADEWSYIADPGEGMPTYVGRRSLYFAQDPTAATEFPVVYVDGQRTSLAEPPAPIASAEKHWVGPWDGERARVVYRRDLTSLCAAVWTVADGSIREDGCLEFDVPAAEPKAVGTIGGDVDNTVFFAGGETNIIEVGDDFLATVNPGQVEIVGRASDRGNTLVTIGEDIGGPHVPEYLTTTEVAVGEGASFASYTFYEIFAADGSYDFVADYVDAFSVGDANAVCPQGESLTTCRFYFGIEFNPNIRLVSTTRVWKFVDIVYDARRRIIVKPEDRLRGSERDITTTIDPNRVIDDYVPLSPVVDVPVWAQRVPGGFEDNVPSYADLGECATVRTSEGVVVEPNALNYFPINIFDEHTIALDGCQPEDSGPELNPITVEAHSLIDVPYLNPGGAYAWTMDDVVFTRGSALPKSGEDAPAVVGGGDGAMVVETDDGWWLIEAAQVDGPAWTHTVLAPAGSPAPRFIGNRRYVVSAGGAVYGLAEDAVVATLNGVSDPAELSSLAHGALLAHDTPQGLTIWSTVDGVPTAIHQTGARSAVLLDASDAAEHLLEREGDVVRIVQTTAARQADLVVLAGDELLSAEISADGMRVLLWTRSSAGSVATMYALSNPTAATWTVAADVVTTAGPTYQFRRATGQVFYQNDVAPGQPDYRAFFIYGVDGARIAAAGDTVRNVAADELGNLVWFDPQERLMRMGWDDLAIQEVALPVVPESNLAPDFYTEDGFVRAVAKGDWFLYDEAGALERVSRRDTTPLSGLRAVELLPPESNVDNGNAIWAGTRGAEALLDPYEAALVGQFTDQVRAFNLLFSARQEDGAFLRAPCLPYRMDDAQADYVSTPFSTWYCVR